METYLKHELTSANAKAQYDTHAKRLLKDKGVLAYILKYSVSEFYGYTLEEAKNAIDGEPEVSTRSVRPEAINTLSNESKLPNEGNIYFDILFNVVTKDNTHQKLYINLEAQKSFYTGYDLVTRSIVYGARLISEQMDTEFSADNYDDVKKVYSIWICMNTPTENNQKETVADTITKYSIKPETLYASNDNTNKIIATGRYDILSSIFICLGKETLNSKNKLIRMLSTLLSPKLPVETKKSILEVEYDLPMTREMESEAVTMCNLSDLIEEEALQKGIQQGEQKATEKYNFIISQKDEQLSLKDEQISFKNEQLSQKDNEIAMLKKLLAEYQK